MQRSPKIILINKIVRFNHAWKASKDMFGDKSNISQALRDQKACLQAELLRDHEGVYLVLDMKTESEEPLYSIKLLQEVKLQGAYFKDDAEHIPVRVADKLFTAQELIKLIKR
jgi:hypothetical protein